MRTAFIQTLTDLALKDKSVMLLTGDLGFTVFENFQKQLPEQFLNVGVAEQNMIGLATGLALSGYRVFCYSIASFATAKPYEQIKLDAGVHRANIVIVGTGSGLSYSTASVTHLSLDDIALMRLIPDIRIFSPADNAETAWSVKTAAAASGPSYIRISRSDEPDFHTLKPKLAIGRGFVKETGHTIAIITSGAISSVALSAAEILKNNSLKPTLISMPSLKPFDTGLIKKLVKQHILIATVEEHGINGGLGSMVAECIAEYSLNIQLLRFGCADRYISKIGSLKTLRQNCGLTPQAISRKILSVYNQKHK